MNAFLVYALEVNFSLFIFFTIYWLALKNEAFYHVNRFLILSLIAVSFVIPFINFSTAEIPLYVANLDTVVIFAKQSAIATPVGWNLPSLLSVIYFAGALVAFVILAKQLFHVLSIIRKGKKLKINDATLVHSASIKAPGSFFKQIFWTNDVLADHEKWILKHEMVHVKEHHSIDVLVIRLAQVACWFNPAIYFLKEELEATHEFRADKIVSETLNDKITYSKILLGQALGVGHSKLAHHFSKPNLLKRRIIMLNKKQNKRKALAKYALLIPTLIGVMAIHACTKEGPTTQNKSEQMAQKTGGKIDGTDIYTFVDQMPEYPGGRAAMMTFLGENIKYPQGCKDDGVEGIVYVSFVIDEDGAVTNIKTLRSPDDRLSASALETVNKMPVWIPGKQDGEKVKVQYSLPIKYQLD